MSDGKSRQGPLFPSILFYMTSLVIGIGFLILQSPPLLATSEDLSPTLENYIESMTDGPKPLPPHCGAITPPGDQRPVCCLNGFVWLDGEPIAGAEVEIQSKAGTSRPVLTGLQPTGGELRPYYRLGLSGAPLDVTPGETITITARYGNLSNTKTYKVRAGGQQFDMVLVGEEQSGDYVFRREIWGQSNPGRLQGPHGIAVDSMGQVYVVDRENRRVQVYDSQGNSLRQWGTKGNQTGQFHAPFGIAIDGSDHLYIADSGNHRIQKFTQDGTFLAVWGERGSADGQFNSPEGVAVDQRGYIYVADSANNRIQKFRSDGKWLATWGEFGSGDGEFNYPTALAIDSQGRLYVADYLNHRVQTFDSDGNWLRSWGQEGDCNGPSGCQNGDLRLPDGITIDSQDAVYVSDTNHRIQRFSNEGVWQTTLGSEGSGQGQFVFPKGLATDSSDGLYVVDQDNNRVQKFGSTLVYQTSWGNTGGNDAQLPSPQGMVVDSDGNLFVADAEAQRVQKFGPTGQWLLNIPTVGNADVQLNGPLDVALNQDGNLYVADAKNNRILKFDAQGEFVTTWGNLGTENAQFQRPHALAVGTNGHVYVVDTFNHRIQQFDGNGIWQNSWGTNGSEDGQFNAPQDIAVDEAGTLYIADTSNHRIQKFDADGNWLATIGRQGGNNGEFDTVMGIDIDGEGNLFAVDRTYRVQKFDSSGAWQATWGEFGSGPGQFGKGANGSELRVTVDKNGHIYVADTPNNRIQLFKLGESGKPIATINHLSPQNLGPDDELEAIGLGQDSDASADVVEYLWESDRDGALGSTATLSVLAAALSPGTHALSLQVRDEESEWSDPVVRTIYVAPPTEEQPQPWTMLLYLAADYNDFDQQLTAFSRALERLQREFNNPALRIAAQLDGPADGDTRRFLIMPNVGNESPEVEESVLGEVAMDQPQSLSDFLRWGQGELPAQNYYLVIANHGQAVQGIAWDKTSDLADDGVSNQSAYMEVRQLSEALSADNVAPVSIVHLDACSMNLLETAYEVKEHTEILIASQYLAWDYFAYADYAQLFGESSSPYELAREIAGTYATQVEADGYPYTISTLDMTRADPTLTAVHNLANELEALIQSDQQNLSLLQAIREESQKFESNGDFIITQDDVYVDLLDWANRIQLRISSPAVKQHAANLIQELTGNQPFIIYNQTTSAHLPPQYASGAYIDLRDANGLSIFYPATQKLREYERYIDDQLFNFTTSTVRWPDYLALAVPDGEPIAALEPLQPLPTTAQGELFLPLIVR